MNLRTFTLLPAVLLTAFLLTGCAIGRTPDAAETISAEDAQSIALAHAGFTADQVSRLHTEYEPDDRAPYYEVQFRQDRWEYEYEIHAETGEILSHEKDD